MTTPMTERTGGSNDAARGRPPTLANLKRTLVDGQEGVGLVEVLVAVAILGITLVVLLSAISTGSVGVTTTEERVTAENLARSQLEYNKSLAYLTPPASYVTVTPPAGYGISAEAASISGGDSYIQKITVTITRDGETLVTVEDFKVDR
jgi:type II secretory pathway pseudopilin PulG